FNTRSFLGKKSATITVAFSHPVSSEIQLEVSGNIRSDLVFDPGHLLINSVRQGTSKSVSTTIHYAGVNSWKIVDVRSSLNSLVADLEEIERSNGSVKYKLTLTLNGHCPEGYIRDQITILTNDAQEREISLPFSARVISALNVSSKQVIFDQSENKTKRLVFRSDRDFVFTKIQGENEHVKVLTSKAAKKTQFVTISYSPRKGIQLPSEIPLRFETSLGSQFSKTVLVEVK
ncbi:MAG: hypothetical protein VX438_01135, partial [Planctomycetota bacterium]|nr:hypothetical protein [Planctomycetota bacterium]